MNFRRNKLAILTGLALMLDAAQAGGLESALDGMYVNYTKPDLVNLQSGHSLVGGSLVARTSTKQIELISFDPPRLSAGCNGIDAYFGAFSMVNKDQIIQLLRAIANNAKGLLFQLAINTLNPLLGGRLETMQKMIQDLNGAAKNSCKIASALVYRGKVNEKSNLNDLYQEITSRQESLFGNGDWFSNLFNREGSKPDAKIDVKRAADNGGAATLDTKAPPQVSTTSIDNKDYGNRTWRALISSSTIGASPFYTCSAIDLANGAETDGIGQCDRYSASIREQIIYGELLMNLVGSEIFRAAPELKAGQAGNGSSKAAGDDIPKVLTVAQLQEPGDTRIRVCKDLPPNLSSLADAELKCLATEELALSTIWPGTQAVASKGMKLLVSYLQGQRLTPREHSRMSAFLGASPIPVLSHLKAVQRDRAMVQYMAELITPILAKAMAIDAAAKLHHGAARIYSDGLGISHSANYETNLNAFASELSAARAAYGEILEKNHALLEHAKALQAALPGALTVAGAKN